jgi:CheY-like chemotaxis protein
MARLAGGVAHDLNNILLVLQGYTEMAMEEAEAAPGMQSLLGEMRAATARAAALVRDLLVIGERGAFAPRLLDLSETARRRVSGLEAASPSGVEIRASLASGLPLVMADEELLGRALEALCARSRESMPAGGTISVSTGVDKETGRACLRVADNGTPLTLEMEEHLFEPYLPGPGGGRGQGLGMSVVQAVVRKLGGEIVVRARQAGTEIEILLPSAMSAAPSSAPDPRRAGPEQRPTDSPPGRPETEGVTILLAEDDEGLRELAVKVLSREGYLVIAARDGEEAVELFRKEAGGIRLVILDDVMPRLGGRAALERIHFIAPQVPLVLCVGYDWRLTDRAAELDGFLSTLSKPWQPRDLLRKVRETLDIRAPAGPGPREGCP